MLNLNWVRIQIYPSLISNQGDSASLPFYLTHNCEEEMDPCLSLEYWCECERNELGTPILIYAPITASLRT